jgi:hypothetical protein
LFFLFGLGGIAAVGRGERTQSVDTFGAGHE